MHKPLNFDNYTFRASSIGKIMTEPVGKSNYEKWLDAVEKFDKAHDDYKAKLEDVEQKINDTPEEKRKLKGFAGLEDKKKKIEESFTEKVLPFKMEVNRLAKIKDEITLSKTCISYLVQIYTQVLHGRKPDITNRYIKKGNQVEEKAIAMLSDLEGAFFVKNVVREKDLFFEGECDVDDSEFSDTIWDTKSSWDLDTFQKKSIDDVNMDYWWQGQIYMELFKANKYFIAYVLLNTPEGIIKDEKRRLLWSMGSNLEDSVAYEEGCAEIEFNCTFDDIAPNERMIKISFVKNEYAIEAAQNRVIACRKWLNEYAKSEFERISNNAAIICNVEYGPKKTLTIKEEVVKQITEVLNEAINTSVNNIEEASEITEEHNPDEITIDDDPSFNSESNEEETTEEIAEETQEDVQEDVGVSEYEGDEDTGYEPTGVVIQKDLEDEIAEIKAEQEVISELGVILERISKLKTTDEVIATRNEYKPLFEKYPEIEPALKAQRDKVKPQTTTSEPIIPAKKPAMPPPMAKSKPVVEEIKTEVIDENPEIAALKKQLEACKTAKDVKDLYAANKPFIQANSKLMIDFLETGKKRKSHPLS